MRNLAVVCCLAVSLACGVSAGPRTPVPVTPAGGSDLNGGGGDEAAATVQKIVLKVGESAELRDKTLTLELESVSNDSRCPVDVQCVWEGDAEIRLCVKGGDQKEETYELHTSPRQGKSSVVERGAWSIKLTNLAPAPHSGRKIDPADYVATFTVTRR
jgi:hypothetical protein